MIWFFLAGMVAGAVGVVMVLRWWMRTHMVKVTKEDIIEELKEDKTHE